MCVCNRTDDVDPEHLRLSSAHRHARGNESWDHGALCHSLRKVCHQQWSKCSSRCRSLMFIWSEINIFLSCGVYSLNLNIKPKDPPIHFCQFQSDSDILILHVCQYQYYTNTQARLHEAESDLQFCATWRWGSQAVRKLSASLQTVLFEEWSSVFRVGTCFIILTLIVVFMQKWTYYYMIVALWFIKEVSACQETNYGMNCTIVSSDHWGDCDIKVPVFNVTKRKS